MNKLWVRACGGSLTIAFIVLGVLTFESWSQTTYAFTPSSALQELAQVQTPLHEIRRCPTRTIRDRWSFEMDPQSDRIPPDPPTRRRGVHLRTNGIPEWRPMAFGRGGVLVLAFDPTVIRIPNANLVDDCAKDVAFEIVYRFLGDERRRLRTPGVAGNDAITFRFVGEQHTPLEMGWKRYQAAWTRELCPRFEAITIRELEDIPDALLVDDVIVETTCRRRT
ncbi:MAG: hypothetical protein ACT4PY_03165 [Armatimonadota bacterium]